MNKIVKLSLIMLAIFPLITGCGCSKKEENKVNEQTSNEPQEVIEDQVFEGLEFVNVGVDNGIITTVVINNTGVVYNGSKFTMKVMDSKGNILVELTDEVKTKMETGTTQTIETKTDIDLSKAASIEYSVTK